MRKDLVNPIFFAILCTLGVQASWAQQSTAPHSPTPDVEDLGNQRYRIGEIEINKAEGVFTVPGEVIRDQPPLEFLVTTKGGHKSYESVLEVSADAYQFNLACILIGLDSKLATPPEERTFDQPVQGDPVEVTVSWQQGNKAVIANGSDFFLHGNPPKTVASQDWVYTGSVMLKDGNYLPDIAGTLLGFVHRGESIIEHQQGIGKGNYGSVSVNQDLVPAVGTPVVLTIRALKTGK